MDGADCSLLDYIILLSASKGLQTLYLFQQSAVACLQARSIQEESVVQQSKTGTDRESKWAEKSCSWSVVRRIISKLKTAGELERVKRGVYAITTSGKTKIEHLSHQQQILHKIYEQAIDNTKKRLFEEADFNMRALESFLAEIESSVTIPEAIVKDVEILKSRNLVFKRFVEENGKWNVYLPEHPAEDVEKMLKSTIIIEETGSIYDCGR